MSRARVFDVYGQRGHEELQRLIVELTCDPHNPSDVIPMGVYTDLCDLVRDAAERLPAGDKTEERFRQRFKPRSYRPHPLDGSEVPFTLASDADTKDLIKTIRYGKDTVIAEDGVTVTQEEVNIRTIVLVNPVDDEQKGLGPLLTDCPDVTVYRLQMTVTSDDAAKNGVYPSTVAIAGYESIPENVDFDAEQNPDDEEIPILPPPAMYGKAAVWAKQLQTPIGFAYPAVITVASVFVKSTASIRATLYTSNMGRIHSGKSLTSTRVRALFSLDHGGVRADWCEDRTPVLDRGLQKLFAGAERKKRLLELDEQRDMMSKGSIENSSLISVLCKLWSQNHAGAADKQGASDCCVELSILGDLKIDDPSEFPSVFTHQTAHGLADRFIYGVRAGEKWRWTNVEFDPFRDTVSPEASEPRLTQKILDLKDEWQDAGEDRDRLAELALRIALITSAVNGDAEITTEAMQAALQFMEWQEKIRRVYRPAKGSNEHEECVIEIEDTFRTAPGRALNWREISQRKNWHRRFPRAIRGMKKMLMDEGKLGYDKKSGKHYLNEIREKRS